jgi:hypothetical protein
MATIPMEVGVFVTGSGMETFKNLEQSVSGVGTTARKASEGLGQLVSELAFAGTTAGDMIMGDVAGDLIDMTLDFNTSSNDFREAANALGEARGALISGMADWESGDISTYADAVGTLSQKNQKLVDVLSAGEKFLISWANKMEVNATASKYLGRSLYYVSKAVRDTRGNFAEYSTQVGAVGDYQEQVSSSLFDTVNSLASVWKETGFVSSSMENVLKSMRRLGENAGSITPGALSNLSTSLAEVRTEIINQNTSLSEAELASASYKEMVNSLPQPLQTLTLYLQLAENNFQDYSNSIKVAEQQGVHMTSAMRKIARESQSMSEELREAAGSSRTITNEQIEAARAIGGLSDRLVKLWSSADVTSEVLSEFVGKLGEVSTNAGSITTQSLTAMADSITQLRTELISNNIDMEKAGSSSLTLKNMISMLPPELGRLVEHLNMTEARFRGMAESMRETETFVSSAISPSLARLSAMAKASAKSIDTFSSSLLDIKEGDITTSIGTSANAIEQAAYSSDLLSSDIESLVSTMSDMARVSGTVTPSALRNLSTALTESLVKILSTRSAFDEVAFSAGNYQASISGLEPGVRRLANSLLGTITQVNGFADKMDTASIVSQRSTATMRALTRVSYQVSAGLRQASSSALQVTREQDKASWSIGRMSDKLTTLIAAAGLTNSSLGGLVSKMKEFALSAGSITEQKLRTLAQSLVNVRAELLQQHTSLSASQVATMNYSQILSMLPPSIKQVVVNLDNLERNLLETANKMNVAKMAAETMGPSMIQASAAVQRAMMNIRRSSQATSGLSKIDMGVAIGNLGVKLSNVAQKSGYFTKGLQQAIQKMGQFAMSAGSITPSSLNNLSQSLMSVVTQLVVAKSGMSETALASSDFTAILQTLPPEFQELVAAIVNATGTMESYAKTLKKVSQGHKEVQTSSKNTANQQQKTAESAEKSAGAMQKITSAASGMMMGLSAAQGNLQGFLLTMIYMGRSLPGIAIGMAALTGGSILFGKAMHGAGGAVEQMRFKLQNMYDTTEDATAAFQYLQHWSMLTGHTMEDIRGALESLHSDGLPNTESAMEAIYNLAAAKGMKPAQAAQAYAEAVNDTENSLESLRAMGVSVTEDMIDTTNRLTASQDVAAAINREYADSWKTQATTGRGALKRIASAARLALQELAHPVWKEVFMPLLNALANAAAKFFSFARWIAKCTDYVYALRMIADYARDTFARFRDEITLLGQVLRLIVIGALYAMLGAFVLVIKTARVFLIILDMLNDTLGLYSGNAKSAAGATGLLAGAFKNVSFTRFVREVKKLFNIENVIKAALIGGLSAILGVGPSILLALTSIIKEPILDWIQNKFNISEPFRDKLSSAIDGAMIAAIITTALLGMPLLGLVSGFISGWLAEEFKEPIQQWFKDNKDTLIPSMSLTTLIGGALGLKVGGPAGAVVGIGAGWLASILLELLRQGLGIPMKTWLERDLPNIFAGASIAGLIGTFILGPGVGTAIGAAVGALAGLLAGQVPKLLEGLKAWVVIFRDHLPTLFKEEGWAGIIAALIILWKRIEEFVDTKVLQFADWLMTNVGPTLIRVFDGIWEGVANVVKNVLNGLSNWLFGNSWTTDVIEGIASGLASLPVRIGSIFGDLASNARSWGEHMMNQLRDGINSAKERVFGAVRNILTWIRNRLGFSVPNAGPLSDADQWMPDMMNLMAMGIETGRGKLESAVSNAAAGMSNAMDAQGSLSPNFGSAQTGGAGGQSGVVVNVNVTGNYILDDATASRLSDQIGTKVVNTLSNRWGLGIR